jgi:hypothetical protein
LAGYRVRGLVFNSAWRVQPLDRLLGPGNGHKYSVLDIHSIGVRHCS